MSEHPTITGTDMDKDWPDWRRGVDRQLTELSVKVAVLTRDVRWIGGVILLLLVAQTGAELR